MITVRDLLIDKARKGGYGFAIERIMQDSRVKNANRQDFRDCLRDAVIDYATEQISVARDYDYIESVKKDTCANVKKQLEAFQQFDNDWELSLLLEDMYSEKVLKSLRKEGVSNE